MATRMAVNGADIKLFINGKVYNSVQQLSWVVDRGEQEIYGIDIPFPQEIFTTKVSIKGKVSGVRVKASGGIQANNMASLITDIQASPYIDIRVQDRHTGYDLLLLTRAKISSESVEVGAKSVLRYSFEFKALIPYSELDRA
jgi:hypothetical protein